MVGVVGNLSSDCIIEVDHLPRPNADAFIRKRRVVVGGAAANVAATMASLGAKVALIADVGRDKRGKMLVQDIRRYGVDTTLVRPRRGMTSEFLVIMDEEGNRTFLLNPEESAFGLGKRRFKHEDFTSITEVVFVGCHIDVALRIRALLGENGARYFANIGFWIAAGQLNRTHHDFLLGLESVFLNHHELGMLPATVRQMLLYSVTTPDTRLQEVIVTSGAQPCQVITASGEHVIPPVLVNNVVNTLGCGDAFMAGYLALHLAEHGVRACCRVGHRCAALVAGSNAERVYPMSVKLKQGS